MTRTVADAAVLLAAMAGADPADPATEAAAGHATDYADVPRPGGARRARLGVWRAGSAPADAATLAVLETIARGLMRAQGAQIIDPVDLADVDKMGEPEFAALTHEFKHDINAYLAGLGGDHPADLAGLIEFNNRQRGRRAQLTSARNFSSRPRQPAAI